MHITEAHISIKSRQTVKFYRIFGTMRVVE